MSKVICDVCGTAYPETATVCPICGSAKQVSEQTAAGNPAEDEQGSAYTYVKGGRFSKRNVRRRNRGGGKTQETRTTAERKSGNEEEESVDKRLVAVIIILLVAIVAVLIYIGLKFFAKQPDVGGTTNPTPTTNVDPTPTGEPSDPTEPPTDANVPCTGLTLPMENISFTAIGGEYTLSVTVAPANTTDTVSFVSADPTIATVTADGLVTAVGYGETTITVTCGEMVKECKVTCISSFTFTFNTDPKWNDPVTGYADTTVTQGSTWKAYKGTLPVPADQITWISDDTTIAIVQNGIVTAISPGKTLIHAQYGGRTFTCIFRCKAPPTTGGSVDTSNPSDTPFSFRHALGPDGDGKYDTTIQGGVGGTWTAYSVGIDPANVAWSVQDESIITVSAEGVVTAVAVGNTELYAVYDGVTFTCIVRVPAT